MVRQATRRNGRAVRAGRVDLRVASADQLPVFDRPFDRVLVVNNFGMWRDPAEALTRLRDAMSSGGRNAIVSQPRQPGATAETTAQAGREINERLGQAGFTDIRSHTLPLSPPVVCVMGTRET